MLRPTPSRTLLGFVGTLSVLWAGCLGLTVSAQNRQTPRQAEAKKKAPDQKRAELAEHYDLPVRRDFRIDGVTRQTLIFVPKVAQENPAPLLFAFHGRGGTIAEAAEKFHYQREWREAIVVYMQGLPVPIAREPDETKSGWVVFGPDEKNRDLKFFDTVLNKLRQDYKVDSRRIYVTGSSFGGAMTYFLWARRGPLFAAVAPTSIVPFASTPGPAGPTRSLADSVSQLEPKPVMVIGGEQDDRVPIERQRETLELLKKLNQCDGTELPLRGHPSGKIYPSKLRKPVIAVLHPGGHGYIDAAPVLITSFFKRHALPDENADSKTEPSGK